MIEQIPIQGIRDGYLVFNIASPAVQKYNLFPGVDFPGVVVSAKAWCTGGATPTAQYDVEIGNGAGGDFGAITNVLGITNVTADNTTGNDLRTATVGSSQQFVVDGHIGIDILSIDAGVTEFSIWIKIKPDA